MIDALPDYMAHFAGYGDLRSPLWFVGMEEGGGRDVVASTHRVDTWAARGHRRLEELAGYHRAIGVTRFFDPPFPLQRTWGRLARVLQASRAAATDHAALRRVQALELGAPGGGAALLELLPLPAASISTWPYAALAGAPLRSILIGNRACYVRDGSGPLFLAVSHPVAHGSTSRFWEAVGAAVAIRTT